jgi:pyrroline-5-carboxylate reductase
MNESIGIIGAGVIGSSVLRSLLKDVYKGKILVAEIQKTRAKQIEQLGVIVTRNNRKVAKDADMLFLCVKPKDLKFVLKEIMEEIQGKLVVSTAAAVPLNFCKSLVPKARFVRIMPNLAIQVQESFTAFCCDDDVTPEEKEKIKLILNSLGKSKEIKEEYMDAITAVSGSGPGYISILIEAITYAGLKVGLPRDLALLSAAQAVLGTAKLVMDSGLNPAQIRDRVTTPGGTTIETIYEIEGSGIRQALMRAIEAATIKSQKIRKNWQ